MVRLNVGGAWESLEGFYTVDLIDSPYTDMIADLNEDWPFKDNSVTVIRAKDVFEHLKDPIHTMCEVWRCLELGGSLLVQVPTTESRAAFQDPTHVSFWNMNSFQYYKWPMNKQMGIGCNFEIVQANHGDYGDSPSARFVFAMLRKIPMYMED